MARFHISISKLPGSNLIVGSVTYTHYLGIIQLNLFTVLDCDRHLQKERIKEKKKLSVLPRNTNIPIDH